MIYRHQSDPAGLTIAEAARITGLSPATLRRYDASGKLRADRNDGNQRRYTQAALTHFMEGRKSKS